MEFIIGYFVGTIIACLVWQMYVKKKLPKPSGAFIIDFTDPMTDVCRLELREDLNDIYTKEYIRLEIHTHE